MAVISTHGSELPRPSAHAEAAAEALRALNHATLRHGDVAGYTWPADVDAVLGSIELLVSRLPQALGQAGRWLTAQTEAGLVGHDASPGGVRDVAHAVAWANESISDAALAATELAGALRAAREATSHLTGVDQNDDQDEDDDRPVAGATSGGER